MAVDLRQECGEYFANFQAKFSKNFLIYFLSYALPALGAFFAISVITRILSPRDYGHYTLALVVMTALATITSAFFGTSVVRFLPAYVDQQGRKEVFYKTVRQSFLVVVIIIACAAIAAFYFLRSMFTEDFRLLLYLAVIAWTLQSAASLLLVFLNAQQRSKEYSLFSIVFSYACLAAGIALIVFIVQRPQALFLGTILGSMVTLPFLYRKVFDSFSGRGIAFSRDLLREMFRYSLPLFFVVLGGQALALGDRYIIGFFKGSADVGIYSIGYQLSDRIIMTIVQLFMLISGPLCYSLWEDCDSRARLQSVVQRVFKYYLLIGFFIVTSLCALAQEIFRFLVGAHFFQGYAVMTPIAIGGFLFGISWFYQIGILCRKKSSVSAFCFLAAVAVNIILNLIFIPRFGYMAAAYVTVFSYGFLAVLMRIAAARYFAWKFPYASFARMLAASVATYVLVRLLMPKIHCPHFLKLALGGIAAMAIYAVQVCAYGEINFATLKNMLFYKKTDRNE
jgi:O-antigen/teichoic acid export membrane protein